MTARLLADETGVPIPVSYAPRAWAPVCWVADAAQHAVAVGAAAQDEPVAGAGSAVQDEPEPDGIPALGEPERGATLELGEPVAA